MIPELLKIMERGYEISCRIDPLMSEVVVRVYIKNQRAEQRIEYYKFKHFLLSEQDVVIAIVEKLVSLIEYKLIQEGER